MKTGVGSQFGKHSGESLPNKRIYWKEGCIRIGEIFFQSFNLEDSISYCLKEISHLVATQCYSGRMNDAIFEMLALL